MQQYITYYENWVRREASWYISLIETLKNFTLFYPGSYNETLLETEAIRAFLDVISLYHNAILDRYRGLTSTLHCKKETIWTKRCKNFLMFFEPTQVLLEMFAIRSSTGKLELVPTKNAKHVDQLKEKWTIILMVEMIKSVCRLCLLYNNDGKIVLPLTATEIAQMKREKIVKEVKKKGKEPQNADPFQDLKMMYLQNGRVGCNSDQNTNQPMDLRSSIRRHGHYVKFVPCKKDDWVPTHTEVMSEVIYIMRPVIHVASRITCEPGSWKPFFLSIFIDVVSKLWAKKFKPMTAGAEEATRRMIKYLWYFVQSPFFDHYTIIPLKNIVNILNRLPLVGPLFSSIMDLGIAMQSLYFYTSAS